MEVMIGIDPHKRSHKPLGSGTGRHGSMRELHKRTYRAQTVHNGATNTEFWGQPRTRVPAGQTSDRQRRRRSRSGWNEIPLIGRLTVTGPIGAARGRLGDRVGPPSARFGDHDVGCRLPIGAIRFVRTADRTP